MRHLLTITLFSIFLCGNTAFASISKTRDQLSKVDKAIAQTQESITAQKNRLETIQHELKKTETRMSNWYKKLAQTNQTLQQSNAKIQQLQLQLNELNKKSDQQRLALAEQLKAHYLLGQKHPLKILLNNENNANIDRMTYYTEILAKSRLEILTAMTQTQQALIQQKADLQKEQNVLTQLQLQQQLAQRKLQDQMKQRQSLMANIDQTITAQKTNLHSLIDDKKKLQTVLTQLQRSNSYSSQYVSSHRGRYAWPIKGTVITEFGQPVKNSQLKTSGIVIRAKSGDTVRAIAPGKVVFADWMPGFGFLMIIDHGQSYMTLYGYNQRLLLPVGAVVAPGDEICTVGNSGGQSQPGLYFGLRHQSKPINPHRWLS